MTMYQNTIRTQTLSLMLTLMLSSVFFAISSTHAAAADTSYEITGYKLTTVSSSGSIKPAVLTLNTTLPVDPLITWPFLFQGTDSTAKVTVHFNGTSLSSFTHEDFTEGYWNYLYIDTKNFAGQKGELRLTFESKNAPVSFILVEDARKEDAWPGYFSGTKPAAGLQLPLNNIAEFKPSNGQIYTCMAITANNQASGLGGVARFDIAFAILSLEQGLIQVVNSRPFNPTNALTSTGETPSCSGRFDTVTNRYTDTLLVSPQTFKVSFELIDGVALKLRLLSAEELK